MQRQVVPQIMTVMQVSSSHSIAVILKLVLILYPLVMAFSKTEEGNSNDIFMVKCFLRVGSFLSIVETIVDIHIHIN